MATLKYKTPEGEWKKVSIGGGGSTEEVYVGSDAPTDDNVKVWIDPTGTPSQPSQPSADNGIRYYVLPEGIAEGMAKNGGYTFTTEEVEKFKQMLKDFSTHTYIFTLKYNVANVRENYPDNLFFVINFQEYWLSFDDQMITIHLSNLVEADDDFSTDVFCITWSGEGDDVYDVSVG